HTHTPSRSHSPAIFFVIIPPPPRSPLFPYTTLFRSPFRPTEKKSPGSKPSSAKTTRLTATPRSIFLVCNQMKARKIDRGVAVRRSEEHTSELQSRRDLVCRLLLEKKKTNKHRSDTPN